MAIKTANVTARVSPEIKEEAERILERLGIPASVVVDALYRQIIFNEGIPFPLMVPKINEELVSKAFLRHNEMLIEEGSKKAFYLTNILEKGYDTKATIIEILRARGFFIDFLDGKYYLSDNASYGDIRFLEEGLTKYNVGRIINNNPVPRYSYRRFVVKPQSVEIIINNKAAVEDAIKVFQYDRSGGEACTNGISWREFVNYDYGKKTDVLWMEPYIAYYCKAISACGVTTWCSCDGNHPDRNINHPGRMNNHRMIVNMLNPQSLWHEAIWKYFLTPKFGNIADMQNDSVKFYFDEQTKKETYIKVYEVADYLYKNRKELREFKRRTCERFTNRFIREHTRQELELFYREECERVLRFASL